MKISYHRRKKIKIRRIAIKKLIQEGIEDPNELAFLLKVTTPTIKKDIEALKTMTTEELTFKTKATSEDILEKKDLILKMLDDENYYNDSGELNIRKISSELKTSRATVLSVLNGE
jgi:biotin operon repressor